MNQAEVRLIGDRYQVKHLIGEGGMGSVYLGFDTLLQRQVAIKFINEKGRLDTIGKDRFQREARVLSKLNHPAICQIYDLVETHGNDAIVLEYVIGQTLTDAQSGLTKRQKWDIAQQLAVAVGCAHDQNLVHRDLKPDNVMITEDFQVKILDFGLAKPLDKTIDDEMNEHTWQETSNLDDSSTQVGAIVGTPKYMSPEQARGQTLTTASDIFSLGLIYQFLFTGQHPYRANLNSVALLWKVVSGESLPLTGLKGEEANLIEQMKSLSAGSRPAAQDVARRIAWIREAPRRRAKRWMIAAIMSSLCVACVASGWGYIRARQSEARAIRQAEIANETLNILDRILGSADPMADGKDIKVRDLLIAYNPADLSADGEIQANLLMSFAKTFLALGELNAATERAEEAMKLRRSLLGSDHKDTWSACWLVADCWVDLGRASEAVELLRPHQGKDVLVDWSLARALDRDGDFRGAHDLYKRLIQEAGSDLALKLDLERDQLNLLLDYGQDESARPLAEQLVTGFEHLYGALDRRTLDATSMWADLLWRFGEVTQAMALHDKVYETACQQFGPSHPRTLTYLSDYLTTVVNQEDWQLADRLAHQLLADSERAFGLHHQETLRARVLLAQTLGWLGHINESNQQFETAIEGYRDLLGPDHIQVILNELYYLEMRLGRGEQGALQRMLELAERAKNTVDSREPSLREVLWIVADGYRTIGDRDTARIKFKELQRSVNEALGEDAPMSLELAEIVGELSSL